MSVHKIKVIHVFSDLNPQLDFIIIPYETQTPLSLSEIQSIIDDAYTKWFTDEDSSVGQQPIADYISSVLTHHGITFEVYFPNPKDE